MAAVLDLPADIVRRIERGDLAYTHAAAIAESARDEAGLRSFLLREALSGQISTRGLRRLAETYRASGPRAARARRPRTVPLGERSWVRLEPIRDGLRAELHIEGEATRDVLRRLGKVLDEAGRE